MILDLIMGIIGFGFSLIAMFLRVILAIIAGVIASFKRRNGLGWGLATLLFPWLFFVVLILPKKYPKLPSHLNNEEAFRGKNPVIASLMALAAMVAKADGSVSKSDIQYIKKFISNHFGVYGEELNSYEQAFNYGKNHPEAYLDFAEVLRMFYSRRELLIAIAYLFVSISMQDGMMSDNEDETIRKILLALGLTEYEYVSLKNSFIYKQAYGQRQYWSNEQTYGQSQSIDLTEKYCEVLGVDKDADMNTIKKAYRKLVKEYHPDKLASESMPEEYKSFADQKIIEINEAYEYLKKVKEA